MGLSFKKIFYIMELRHSRRAFVNRAYSLDRKASIANSYAPSDTSEGFCCIWTFRFGRCSLVKDFTILLSFYFAVEWAKIVGYRSTESSLRKACLVRVRHNVAHQTSATALDFARCRHGKMFALSSDVPLHLFFKVLPLSPLWVQTADKMLPLLLNRIDCHITLCKPKAR